MLKNKRIDNPNFHYKLEYDIKTNDDIILKVLEKIQSIISKEFNQINSEAEVTPIIIKIDYKQ